MGGNRGRAADRCSGRARRHRVRAGGGQGGGGAWARLQPGDTRLPAAAAAAGLGAAHP